MNDPAPRVEGERALLALYDRALPGVYGYLYPRCGTVAIAEDLTAETFLAAVQAPPEVLSVAWLIGVARHKLADHWRRKARDERALAAIADPDAATDPWDTHMDIAAAQAVLASLGAHHRLALTLRYVDGLAVQEVANLIGRTVHATEALLVRARAAFRNTYTKGGWDAC